MTDNDEPVVLLDSQHRPIGTAPKATVHTTDTPLHLAFSSYLLNDEGELLLTRRALSKVAWPGVWTNSACGHPLPDEAPADAARRRCRYELGVEIHDVTLLLPDFAYRAQDASGIVENEFCPVFSARCAGDLHLRPSEVMDSRWVSSGDLLTAVAATPWAFSPWMVAQLQRLQAEGITESWPGLA
ncbi:isopentenyl-diphosphate Delta-isomerase [Marinobacter halodurans]|uniref:Isopentenyl-diphosphate Delta-isomerase n=1 Tax=Marinobacter halodurans TaxID=2528979 RepID=A0ABY1ZN73_9GAMM|nr:isopentenyl-diphosphate Delta-isomerase [Marinobacter halodurans]TBW57696.1 isopentenyl-diphosphate Delta-isomerase [Marinobacter halodurans]